MLCQPPVCCIELDTSQHHGDACRLAMQGLAPFEIQTLPPIVFPHFPFG